MSPWTRRPDNVNVYRTAGASRRRRLALIAAAAVLVAATVAAAWAWRESGGSGAPAAAGASPPAAIATAGDPSPSPSPAAAPAPVLIEVGWVGDTTPGSRYGMPPDRGRALFARVRDRLRAPDLMIANLEGTYSEGGRSKCDGEDSSDCFAFQAPPSYAKTLQWAGIDVVSLANNHSHDYFERGLDETKAALEKNGVAYTGLPGQIRIVDVGGVRVAALGFSPYYWNADLNDIPTARALVRRAAGRSDVVVVLMHAGAEGAGEIHTPKGAEFAYGENRGDSRAFAHAVVDAGADLVLGSGPHVIRGIERYRERLIAYSLGDFAGWNTFGLGGNLGLSGLLTVEIDERGRIRGGRWLSLRLTEPGVPVADPAHTSARLVEQLSAEDFAETYRMDGKGRIAVP
jgi:hypothetical protein